MPLTDVQLRSLKPDSRPRKFADFEGLFVLVTPSGSRLWRLAYRFAGKQKMLALGSYPETSLRDARRAKDDARKLLEQGQDPAHERKVRKLKARVSKDTTFEGVANEWFRSRKSGWVAAYAERLRSRLDADLLPQIGKRPIADIEPIELLACIRSVEARDAPEMARRILQMASAIFRYGVATGRCPRDPAADLRGALKPANAPKRRSALRSMDLGKFMRRLIDYEGDAQTRLALMLVVYTFARTSEVRFARWVEFEDLRGERPLWRIPAERMKMRREHLVPLSPQVVTILEQLRPLAGASEFVFPAPTRSKVISENTMLYALYRMGYHSRATVHGFRSTASTILNEHEFNRDWIEMQLAHFAGDVRSIYNAAEWITGRRTMMNWWSDYLDRASSGTSLGGTSS